MNDFVASLLPFAPGGMPIERISLASAADNQDIINVSHAAQSIGFALPVYVSRDLFLLQDGMRHLRLKEASPLHVLLQFALDLYHHQLGAKQTMCFDYHMADIDGTSLAFDLVLMQIVGDYQEPVVLLCSRSDYPQDV